MQQLVVVLADFGMRLPTDVVLLSRALVTLDGTLRVLSPGRSLMTSALQMLDSPTEAVVDRDQLVRDELMAALPHLRRLPERVDRILGLTGRGELRIRTVIDEDSRRILRTLVNRVLLGGIGAAVLAVSAVLLVAADPGPAVSQGTGLFEVFGYGGLLAGAVLVLRVVAAVARDGTT
jgi:ubiquinone biosynthesis protein